MIRPDFQRATAISCAAHALLFLTALAIMGLRPSLKNKVYTISLVSPAGSSSPASKRPARRTPPPKKIKKTSPVERTPPVKKPAMAVKEDPAPSQKRAKEAIEKLRQEKEAQEAEAHRQERLRELEDKRRLEELRSRLATEGASDAEGQAQDGQLNEILNTYRDKIIPAIRENWVFPDVSMGIRTEVSITVFADGTIRINQITTPSGNRAFDQSVLKAIVKTGSVEPPPFGRNEDIILNFIPVRK